MRGAGDSEEHGVNVMTFAVLAVEGWSRILFDVNTGGNHDINGKAQLCVI